MSDRFNTYDDYPSSDPNQIRRSQRQRQSARRSSGDGYAPVSAGAAIRQQQNAQRGAAGSKGRLDYDSTVNDHGRRASHRTARDYDRSRYGGQRSATAAPARQQQTRRRVELDQSGQIPRYNPANDPRSREQIAAQRNRNVQNLSQGANRFARANGAYQARPDKVGNAASTAQGILATPFSMLVRVGLIVILVAFFGIRMLGSAGPAAQLEETTAAVATQQEELDKITSENETLQKSIDSRQSTIDAYNDLVKSQS